MSILIGGGTSPDTLDNLWMDLRAALRDMYVNFGLPAA